MALLFCDSFDAYAATGDINSKYSGAGGGYTWVSNAGKFGTGALVQNSGGSNSFTITTGNIGANFANTLNFGGYIKISNGAPVFAPSTSTPWMGYPNSSGNSSIIGLTTGGNVCAMKLGAGTTILATGSKFVCDGAWHWLEISFLPSTTSSGFIKIWIDGLLDTNYSGVTAGAVSLTGSFTYCNANSASASGGAVINYDDIVIWDNTGSFMNTAPVGPRRIACLNPNGAGASTQFAPSTGSNWSCVSQAYSGTANVSDASTGHTDLYTTAGMPYTVAGTVNAVVVNHYSLNPAGDSTKNIASKLRSGGTIATGTSRTLGVAAANYQDPYYQDSSGVAWTQTSVNSAQPGVGD